VVSNSNFDQILKNSVVIWLGWGGGGLRPCQYWRHTLSDYMEMESRIGTGITLTYPRNKWVYLYPTDLLLLHEEYSWVWIWANGFQWQFIDLTMYLAANFYPPFLQKIAGVHVCTHVLCWIWALILPFIFQVTVC
jgi:hypothetical protein